MHGAAFALAHEIRMGTGSAEPRIVRGRDDVVERDQGLQVRDRVEDLGAERGRAVVGHSRRRVRPRHDVPPGDRRGELRRHDDARDRHRFAVEAGRGVEDPPRLRARRRIAHLLGADQPARGVRRGVGRRRVERSRRRRPARAAERDERGEPEKAARQAQAAHSLLSRRRSRARRCDSQPSSVFSRECPSRLTGTRDPSVRIAT